MDVKQEFPIGSLVKRKPEITTARFRDQIGVVEGYSLGGDAINRNHVADLSVLRVRFGSNKTVSSLHYSFVLKVEPSN